MARNGIAGFTIVVLGGGSVLLYAGLKGKSVSDVLRSLVSGQDPTTVAATNTLNAVSAVPGNVNITPSEQSPAMAGGGNPTANKAIARLLAAPFGWSSGAQWTALDNLWTRESGWDNTVINGSSGAAGIAQALGHGTASSAATAHVHTTGGATITKIVNEYPSKAANSGVASAQIAWGLSYIHGTYGSPVAAWAHEQAFSWY